MARFNLGCIKGNKGDAGPKGDKGDKGDTGERGLSGADGITPVFSINKVETLDSSCDANVEIDASVPAQPRLNFYIPRGADGADAAGDMQAAVYDKTGVKRDIYEYAQELFEGSIKKDGDSMSGKLVAYEGEISERCVRNISFSTELPTNAVNGDLCFVLADVSGKKLSDCEIGSVILLEEGQNNEHYIIVAKDYHRKGSVTLARRYLTKYAYNYDHERRNSYSGSDIDVYLEAIYLGLFSPYIRNNVLSAELDSIITRRCFLPSESELKGMEYFVNNGAKGCRKGQSVGTEYMTRDLTDTNYVVAVNPEGEFTAISQKQNIHIRPMITLSGDMYVENTVYDSEAVSQPIEKMHSLYMYKDGGWKELSV